MNLSAHIDQVLADGNLSLHPPMQEPTVQDGNPPSTDWGHFSTPFENSHSMFMGILLIPMVKTKPGEVTPCPTTWTRVLLVSLLAETKPVEVQLIFISSMPSCSQFFDSQS